MMRKLSLNFTRLLTLALLACVVVISSCGDDDETAPATISFAAETASIDENETTGETVFINLSSAAQMAGTFTVSVASNDGVYGTDFTTNPAAENGTVTFDVAAGDAEKSIVVMPIDNEEYSGDITVTMALTPGENVIVGDISTVTVTIMDDETEPTSIADLRAMYTGATVDITEDIIVEGVVTSVGEAQSSLKNLFIQDATGGIAVRFTADHEFAQGTKLRINANGAQLSEFNGLLQINNAELTNVQDLGDAPLPSPTVVTIDELNTGDYEGQLIVVENVSFVGADGIETFAGNNIITDGTDQANIRVENFAPFRNDPLPLGTGNVTGIAGEFSGNVQINLQQRSDVFANDPAGTISPSIEALTFGAIDNGAVSASQSYTVTFDGDIAEVEVSAPSHFEISLDNVDFTSNSVTVTNSGATVYVRFAPASGSNGEVAGEITHTASAAVTTTVSVSGTEGGNDPGTITPGLFISEYAEGSGNNKYVEIYNPTDNAIDLADYQLWGSNNGGDWKEERKLQLTGTIQPGDVFIISADEADAAILAEADMERAYESPVHYNGDDAVALLKADGNGGFTLIDVIGVPTEDPGSAWDVAGTTGATSNHTIVRKPSVVSGNTNWAASAGTDAASSEWTVLDQDDWTDLGSHTIN